MSILDRLQGGLIVSVQAWRGSAIDRPDVLAAIAQAAQANGAAALRMQGEDNVRAGRLRTDVPMIGLIKREYAGYAPYITPTFDEVAAIIATGAEIVAFDATSRERPNGITVETLIGAIHDAGRLAMADCATIDDGIRAKGAGADIVATTLCGYTDDTEGLPLPAYSLVGELARLDAFVVCEGGVHRPDMVARAFESGANAVVVGTAITNIDWLVRQFAAQSKRG